MFFSPKALLALAAFAPAAYAQGGIFIVQCSPLTVQRADPIVNPGSISHHVHAVVGGTKFGFSTTNEDARNSRETTCSMPMDKSQYWQPQLYHMDRQGKFEPIKMLGIAAYYLDRTCDYAPGRRYCDGTPTARAPPRGLRMVVGNPFRKDYNDNNMEHRAISHVCLDPAGPEVHELPQAACKEQRSQTYFPSCWNGRDLDSPNHKDHVAFPVTGAYDSGVCPESHPIAIQSVFTEFFYNNRQIAPENFNKWVYAQGDGIGYGLHGDYVQGWTDQGAFERAMDTCSGNNGLLNPNCSVNVGEPGRVGQAIARDPEIAPPSEQVGLNGKLDRLPGNHEPYFAGQSAKMKY